MKFWAFEFLDTSLPTFQFGRAVGTMLEVLRQAGPYLGGSFFVEIT